VRGRSRMWVETGGCRAEVGEPDGVPLTVASVTLSASERCCSRSWRSAGIHGHSDCAGLQGNGPATRTPSALGAPGPDALRHQLGGAMRCSGGALWTGG